MKNKQSFYKCKNCGDEIGVNTNSRLVYCKCGKLGVDGNEYYVRVIGEGDVEVRAVQIFLGHSDLRSTQIYTHYVNPELKQIHGRLMNF